MGEDLFNWLEKQWRYSNHKKYHKYFSEWVGNITETQLIHFDRMRINGNVYVN